MGFGLAYLDLILAYSEGQLDCRNGVSSNFVCLLVLFVIKPKLNTDDVMTLPNI